MPIASFTRKWTLAGEPRDVHALHRDASLLLASLAPVSFLFARTFAPPTSLEAPGEYPWFVLLNVVAIAGCGAIAVIAHARSLRRKHGFAAHASLSLTAAWLTLSLLVGAQGAWYLRPFFGNRAAPDAPSFCRGTSADEYGSSSFYQAVYRLVARRNVSHERTTSGTR